MITSKWLLKRKPRVVVITVNLSLSAHCTIFSLYYYNYNYCCCFCFSLISTIESLFVGCGIVGFLRAERLIFLSLKSFLCIWDDTSFAVRRMSFVACALHRPDARQHGRLWAAWSVLPREGAGHPVDQASTPASEAPEAWRERDADDTVTGRHRPQNVCAHSQRNERSHHVIGLNLSQDIFRF